MSDLNQSAIKAHALVCSEKHRAGRFTRVGQDFLDEINAEVEAVVRDLKFNRFPQGMHDVLPTEKTFVTGALLEKIREALDAAVARMIQSKVGKQPSVGRTLGRTR